MPSSPVRDGLIGVAVFAGSLPATRVAVEAFDPLAVTVARAALAALAAGLYVVVARRPLPVSGDRAAIGWAALCLVFGFPWLMALATVTAGAAHGAVILGLLPLATATFAVLIGRERPSLRFWGFAVTGAALVVAFAWRAGSGAALAPADLLLFAAVAAAAAGYAIAGTLTRTMNGVDVIAWQIIGCAPIALLALPFVWSGIAVPDAGLRHWLALGYVAVFSQFVGFWFWNRALAEGGIARIGQIQLLQTFFSLAIAGLLLGEAITAEMVVFAALVAATVWAARNARVARA